MNIDRYNALRLGFDPPNFEQKLDRKGHSILQPEHSVKPDEDVLSAWREGLAQTSKHPDSRQRLLQRQSELLPRFAEHYEQLKQLPRRTRRSLQRHCKRSLAGVALGAQPTLAATINVGGQCTLIRAIVAVNNDASPQGFCRPGRGADTIVLPRNSTQTLTAVNNTNYGATGLPTIRTQMAIMGNGSTIRRASNAPAFRLLAVVDNRGSPATCPDCSRLTLSGTTLTGGKAVNSAARFSADGGAMLNISGVITLTGSGVSGNTAAGSGGGEQYSDFGTTGNFFGGSLTLINSTVSGNRASERGGGISNGEYGSVRMTNSTVSGNTAGSDGGGVFNGYQSGVTVTNSTISGNAARNGGGIHSYDPRPGSGVHVANTTFTANTARSAGGGIYTFSLDMKGSILSGNSAADGQELYIPDNATVTASNFNVLGHRGLTNARAFVNFTSSGTDITAISDGDSPTRLGAILNRSLASNGGPTRTHALVVGSPAVMR
ncbi:MAG: hypothetical protein H0V62_07825 [Gammaproteobacteria bacterium]|nr:hypothetical protein [Gammaproteobacteria bacterium]